MTDPSHGRRRAAEPPPPLTDVRQISHIAYGFMASKALFAGLGLELFGHIANGATDVAALSAACKVAENRMATLLAALASLGLVVRRGDRYENAPATAYYLVPGAPAYFGDYYRFQIDRQLYPNMLNLDAGLRGEEENLAHQSMRGWLSGTEDAESFSRAQHAGSLGPARLMAGRIDLSRARRLLDVAGGTGAYSITFCREHPALTATIIDFPSVIEISRRYVDTAGMADRITLLPGDALEVAWPGGQDVVLFSYLLSAVGGGDIPGLLDRAWTALTPGGRLIVHDFMLAPGRDGPVAAASFFLSYLSLRTDPVSFTADDIAEMLGARGFREIETGVMIPEITEAVVAARPPTG